MRRPPFALLVAPIVAVVGAAVFGFFIVRLHGTYLAMLSLAAAQIVYAVAFQWTEFTGGDNGMIGLWPSPWAASRPAYYYLVLCSTAAGILLLRHLTDAPLGFVLRAARDSSSRADAIGVNVRAHRWLAFSIAGAAAGLGGGLHTFMNGSIDPTLLSIQVSVDGLVMLLLGGLQTIVGSIVGAVTLHMLKSEFIALTDYWRLFLGLSIIGLVMAFPRGLMGAFHEIWTRWQNRTAGRRDATATGEAQ